MNVLFKKILKYIAALSPVPLTQNERYDRLTGEILQRLCGNNSVCVDVGAHDGKVLALIIKNCPGAMHYAFEPLPAFYHLLKRKFGSACHIYKVALSNQTGIISFVHFITNPAYSGLRKRPEINHESETIEVRTDLLDNVLPPNQPVALIKIDVEGAEYLVIQGAAQTIRRWKPHVLFEFGKGGSEVYNITPRLMFDLLKHLGLQINLLYKFILKEPALTVEQFEAEYHKGKEYFFVAYPCA